MLKESTLTAIISPLLPIQTLNSSLLSSREAKEAHYQFRDPKTSGRNPEFLS